MSKRRQYKIVALMGCAAGAILIEDPRIFFGVLGLMTAALCFGAASIIEAKENIEREIELERERGVR